MYFWLFLLAFNNCRNIKIPSISHTIIHSEKAVTFVISINRLIFQQAELWMVGCFIYLRLWRGYCHMNLSDIAQNIFTIFSLNKNFFIHLYQNSFTLKIITTDQILFGLVTHTINVFNISRASLVFYVWHIT